MSSENDALATLSAAEIGRRIGSGALDPTALAEAACAAAAARPDIYVRVLPERALSEADAARTRAELGVRRGPLDGAPISWKDLFAVAGAPTQAGSPLLRDAAPEPRDAPLVARAAQAGLVCVGKTHMSELAFSGLGLNPKTATPPNRYDPARAPGGSSAGAAASIAFGTVPAAMGTDTGGSVRIPAAWNGLVGLKTTTGALPMAGVAPLSRTLDTAGPLTRTVEDAALFWSVLSGTAPPDLRGARVDRLRLLAVEGPVLDGVDAAVRAGHEAALARLEAAGATIVRRRLDALEAVGDALASGGPIVAVEGIAEWRAAIEAAPGEMFAMTEARFLSGAAHRAEAHMRSRFALQALSDRVVAEMAGFDALIMPSVKTIPPPADALLGDPDAYLRENLAALHLTSLANVLALCALSLPAGPPVGDGLPPASAMLVGPPHAERSLLCAAAAIEAVR